MFQGSAVALVTPFKQNAIDYDALDQLIEFHIKAETECIVICGTTGESATLSHVEHRELIERSTAMIKEKRGTNRYPLMMAGTGSNNTKEALELTQHAKNAGADCVLLISPYYNKPTPQGILQHFQLLAREVDIPQVVYNIQSRTGINISTDVMVELSKEKNIIGVKEASGNITQMSDVARRCGDDFMIWSGDDAMTLPLLAIGGHGVISVSANIIPKDVRAMVHAYLQGDYKEALQLHRKMADLSNTLFVETNPVPVKTACNLLSKTPDYGLPHCGEFRLPMVEMLPQNLDVLQSALKTYGLPV